MSLLLVVAPKRELFDLEYRKEKILDSLERNSRLFLGPRYATTPETRDDLNANGAWIAQWFAKNGKDDDCFYIKNGTWAAASSNKVAKSLVDNVRSSAGSVYFDDPVWGSFAAVHGDTGSSRLVAWNTVPAVDPIYFADDDECFYISNRPVICKLAMTDGDLAPSDLNLDYLVEYLEFGHSFSGVTPFIGVRTLSSRSALSIFGSRLSLIPAPYHRREPLQPSEDARRTGSKELAGALIDAAERCVQRSSYDELQIRLSGGFDSRLLLGLFSKYSKENILCVTHGVASDAEVAIASELTDLAGVQHVVKAPEPLVPGDYMGSLLKSIGDSGGLIPSESLVAPFSPTDPFKGGGSISLGQWPLFKGYLDKIPTSVEYEVILRIVTRTAGLVGEAQSEYCLRAVEEWMSSMGAMSNAEVLYNFARDQRSSKYLEAQTSQTDRECQISYPLVDSEVTCVSDSLPLSNRALNYASFLALQEVWPESLSVPLNTTQTLRFEANGPVAGISGDSFDQRRREPHPFKGTVTTPSYKGTQFEETLRSVEFYTAEFVRNHRTWPMFQDLLDEETLGTVEKTVAAGPGGSGGIFSSYVEKRKARVAFSRLALGAMWVSGEWL